MLIMSGTILFCLILVGVTIYYTYQYHQGALTQTANLVDSLKTTATSLGAGGPQ